MSLTKLFIIRNLDIISYALFVIPSGLLVINKQQTPRGLPIYRAIAAKSVNTIAGWAFFRFRYKNKAIHKQIHGGSGVQVIERK